MIPLKKLMKVHELLLVRTSERKEDKWWEMLIHNFILSTSYVSSAKRRQLTVNITTCREYRESAGEVQPLYPESLEMNLGSPAGGM